MAERHGFYSIINVKPIDYILWNKLSIVRKNPRTFSFRRCQVSEVSLNRMLKLNHHYHVIVPSLLVRAQYPSLNSNKS